MPPVWMKYTTLDSLPAHAVDSKTVKGIVKVTSKNSEGKLSCWMNTMQRAPHWMSFSLCDRVTQTRQERTEVRKQNHVPNLLILTCRQLTLQKFAFFDINRPISYADMLNIDLHSDTRKLNKQDLGGDAFDPWTKQWTR